MIKHTQTICRLFADELFESVWSFCGIGAKRVKPYMIMIYEALRNLVPFKQFKKREKHPRRNVTFSKVTG